MASITVPIFSDPEYLGFDHITWYVGNAKQAASYFITRMAFKQIAYSGAETGSRSVAKYVIANGKIVFVLVSPIRPPPRTNKDEDIPKEEKSILEKLHEHQTKHGDGIKDVAFRINGDVNSMYTKAVERGAVGIRPPETLKDNEGSQGQVVIATIGMYGDTVHSLVNREGYSGCFLPGFEELPDDDPINGLLPQIELFEIDHCVGNQAWNGINKVVEDYKKHLNFPEYWSVDDENMCSDYSAMRSIVVASPNEVIKMPLNEPAEGKKSQIEEFVDFYNGPCVQHITFRTDDIVKTVSHMKRRGVIFLDVPETYYSNLCDRLEHSKTNLKEDLKILQKLNILVDFDEKGYLLQIFTKHVLDCPTVFIEIIQRNNFNGFGAGNFKSLFEALERYQALRGNL